jgi:hypothetical protein
VRGPQKIPQSTSSPRLAGWHLPLLKNLPDKVQISAIVEPSPQPRSTLVKDMLSRAQLESTYEAPVFESYEDYCASEGARSDDGVLIASPHATHARIGLKVRMDHAREGGACLTPSSWGWLVVWLTREQEQP